MADSNCLEMRFRPATFGDYWRIAEIDAESFGEPTQPCHVAAVHQRHGIILAVDPIRDKPLGFMILRWDGPYPIAAGKILRVAVDPAHRRQGIATQLLRCLAAGLWEADVRESNLPAQLWLKSCGFRWYRTLKRAVWNPHEDLYQFMKEVSP